MKVTPGKISPQEDPHSSKNERIRDRSSSTRKRPDETNLKFRSDVRAKILDIQTDLSKYQTILRAVETLLPTIRSQSNQNTEDSVALLIENTTFGEERILTPYKQALEAIVQNNDDEQLNGMIQSIREQIRRSIVDLGKTRILGQNLLAASQSGDGLDSLLKSVVDGIGDIKDSDIRLARERVIDLLG
jgi:hypothetical protein